MNNNQTIDGVPRALLDLCYRALNGGDNQLSGMEHGQAFRELRALLDAPAAEERGASHGFEQSPNTCRHDERAGVWWREWSITRTGRECCACGSVEEDPVEPAAQPQGEPVAYQRKSKTEGAEWHYIHGCDVAEAQRLGYEVRPLYAEQPAPVALVLPERKPEPSCMTAVDDDREAAIWNARLDEATRLNQKPRMCDCNQGRLSCTCK